MENITPRRALAIVAHPDDIEYYCGGTIAKWTNDGCTVSYLIVSSGDKGSNDLTADISKLVHIRETEQIASAKISGVEDVTFLKYPDSELSFVGHNKLREEFVRHIRRTRAEVVLSHDPLVRFSKQHPDHRTVGQLTLDACFPISSVALCYPSQITDEGLDIWQPSYLFQFGTDSANYHVDISNSLETKIKALKAHVSQEAAFHGGIEARLRWRAKTIGEKYDLEAGEEFLAVQVGPTLPES